MRALFLLFALILVTVSYGRAEGRERLYGWFYKIEGNSRIEVIEYKKEIKVRGLIKGGAPVFFRHSKSRGYISECGTFRLQIKQSYYYNRVIIHDRHNCVDVYEQENITPGCGTIIERHETYWDKRGPNPDKYREEHYDDVRDSPGHHTDFIPINPQAGYIGAIEEGRYRASDGREIFVLLTRDGIKARFTDDLNWRNYSFNNGKYVDSVGNYYQIVADKKLTWTGGKSGASINLTKISDRTY